MISLNDIVGMDNTWTKILDSVLPGGENWHKSLQKGHNCLEKCPGKKGCNGNGPDKYVCSEDWQKSEADMQNLEVLKHVLKNFDHYDKNDCTVEDKDKKVDMLLSHIYHWDNLIQLNFPSR